MILNTLVDVLVTVNDFHAPWEPREMVLRYLDWLEFQPPEVLQLDRTRLFLRFASDLGLTA